MTLTEAGCTMDVTAFPARRARERGPRATRWYDYLDAGLRSDLVGPRSARTGAGACRCSTARDEYAWMEHR